jgi:Cof subfamily protein (haloacid dehalogenase superfamily)
VGVLYVSDLDGTLLNDNQVIDVEAIEIINQLIDKGLNFSIATARSIESARELVKGLHLKLPIILINGVFIFDTEKSHNIQSNYLSSQLGAQVVQTYLQLGLNPLVYTTDSTGNSRIYYRGIFNKSEENYIGNRLGNGDRRFSLIHDYEECIHENIMTVNAIECPQNLETAYKEYINNEECVCHFGPDIYTLGFNWLEISSRQATKKEAVLYLKNKFNFERLVCFGDNLNDLPMFEAADEKYAVSNAHEIVLNTVDKIIESNNDNGVAKYLRTYWR